MQIKNERNDLIFNQPLFGQPTTQPSNSTASQRTLQQSNHANQNNSSTLSTAEKEPSYSEDQIDIESIKGRFGWTEVGGVNIPYLLRKDEKYVSVRMVEQKILSKYPNCYPEELKKRSPLESHFVTQHEAKLLNEINATHCCFEYGRKEFSLSELIVLLKDFIDFLSFVQKTFPEKSAQRSGLSVKQIPQASKQFEPLVKEKSGWLQVNNTVTPYITRLNEKFVPLSIMKYAAKINILDKGVLPTIEECNLLNKMCESAGFKFVFINTTRIVSLTAIRRICSLHIKDLPSANPLSHVRYVVVQTSSSPTKDQPSVQNSDKTSNGPTVASLETTKLSPVSSSSERSSSVRINTPNKTSSMTITSQTGQQIGNIQSPQISSLQQQVNGMRYGSPFGIPFGLPFPNLIPPYGVISRQYLGNNINPTSSTVMSNRFPPPYPGFGFTTLPGTSPQVLDMSKKQTTPSTATVSSSVQPQTAKSNVTSAPNSYTVIYNNNTPMTGTSYDRNQNINNSYPIQTNKSNAAVTSVSSSARPNGHTDKEPRRTVVDPTVNGSKHVYHTPLKQSLLTQCFINASKNQVSTAQNNVVNRVVPNSVQTNANTTVSVGHLVNNTTSARTLSSLPHIGNVPQVVTTALKDALNKRKLEKPGTETRAVFPQSVHSTLVTSASSNSSSQIKTFLSANLNTASHKSVPNISTPSQAVVLEGESNTTSSIKVEVVAGKSISCIHRTNVEPKGKFCLVEVICRLYFNGCCVNEFLFALENVFKVRVVACTEVEEKAFIEYYSLHVTALKCNKLMDAVDLEKYYPQLSYVFKDSKGDQSDPVQPSTNLKRRLDSSPIQDNKVPCLRDEDDSGHKKSGQSHIITDDDEDFSIIILDD